MPESIALNPPHCSLVNSKIPSTKGSLPNLNQLLGSCSTFFNWLHFLTTFFKKMGRAKQSYGIYMPNWPKPVLDSGEYRNPI